MQDLTLVPAIKMKRIGIALAGLAIAASTGAGQVVPEKSKVIRTGKPGIVVVDKGQRGWVDWTLDAMAARSNKVVFYCNVFQTSRIPGHYDSTGTIELPDGLNGMRQFAATAGYEVVDRGSTIVYVEEAGDEICDRPILAFAEPLKDLGRGMRSAVSAEKLELKLMQTAETGLRTLDASSLHGTTCFSTYYWPTVEGKGREFYVLQQNSGYVSAKHPTTRLLRKVAVKSMGGDIEIEDLWVSKEHGGLPTARYIQGPVADLELDFDQDGVVDVVVFSGLPSNTRGQGPLHVLSGKTGEEIGMLEGYEFLLTEDTSGRPKVRTLETDGYRDYVVSEDGKLKIAHRDPLEERTPTKTILQRRTSGDAAASGSVEGRIIDNFVLPIATAPIDPIAFSKLRRLKELGEEMTAQFGKLSPARREARVYADYKPVSPTDPSSKRPN